MNYDKVKNPSGDGRVEALTIGLREAIAIMVIIVGSGGGSALWLNNQLQVIRTIVQQNSYDRWTRSQMEQLCRILERDNETFRCPEELPRFEAPDDPFTR